MSHDSNMQPERETPLGQLFRKEIEPEINTAGGTRRKERMKMIPPSPEDRLLATAGVPACGSLSRISEPRRLSALRPDLAREWHPTKNGNLSPRDITPDSSANVWWLCANGHWWQAAVRDRIHGLTCTLCRERIKQGSQRMADARPELLKEWHPTRNQGVRAREVPSNYKKAVWWLCEHGHEWKAGIPCRISGKGCPVCKNAAPRAVSIKSKAKNSASPPSYLQVDYLSRFDLPGAAVTPRSGQELRKVRRYEHSETVMIENSMSGIVGYAQMRNFSGAGLMLQADYAIGQGDIITIRIGQQLYPSASNAVAAKVVWCRNLDGQSERDDGFGIGLIIL